MDFQIRALPEAQFEHLLRIPPEELARHGATFEVVAKKPGTPCRVSLVDAEVGEKVFLVHYEHQPANTPFRASHAIFVRAEAKQTFPAVNEVPELFRIRLLSLRAFDDAGMMVDADVIEGGSIEVAIDAMFSRAEAAYIHIHYAKPGCYGARVDRA